MACSGVGLRVEAGVVGDQVPVPLDEVLRLDLFLH